MRAAAAVLLGTLLGGSAAWAQHPQVRDGFWIGFGFGYGSLSLSCTGCGDSLQAEGSWTGHLKMGGTVSPKVLIGGEINGWSKEEGGETLTAGSLSAAVTFYPAPASGFFLRGGLGFAVFEAEAPPDKITGDGPGLVLGAGYDIRVGRNLSITPLANFFFGSIGEVELEGFGSTDGFGLKQKVFEFGFGITFH